LNSKSYGNGKDKFNDYEYFRTLRLRLRRKDVNRTKSMTDGVGTQRGPKDAGDWSVLENDDNSRRWSFQLCDSRATDDEGGGWRSDQKASLGIGTLSDVKVTKFVQKDSPSTTTSDFLSG
jgi:hypothetical protein